MTKVAPFEQYAREYDDWFDRNQFAYLSELRAIEALLPEDGVGLEIGVGSGRFAAPLGIQFGLDPSRRMRALAAQRGIQVVGGVAEQLPFRDSAFDFALMVTTLCFLDDVLTAFREAHRILKSRGHLTIGFIDAASDLGKQYLKDKDASRFFRHAEFYTVNQVAAFLAKAGFADLAFRQTLFSNPDTLNVIEPIEEGSGRGSFVVARAARW